MAEGLGLEEKGAYLSFPLSSLFTQKNEVERNFPLLLGKLFGLTFPFMYIYTFFSFLSLFACTLTFIFLSFRHPHLSFEFFYFVLALIIFFLSLFVPFYLPFFPSPSFSSVLPSFFLFRNVPSNSLFSHLPFSLIHLRYNFLLFVPSI